jgi:cell division protein ZapA (FtsZ GTPase activity inhibitor)
MSESRSVTTIEIAGEEYTVRSEGSREHTLECARYVNDAVAEVMSRGSLVEAHKAAILAALALADQLLQARRDAEQMREELTLRSRRLLAEIEERALVDELASDA